MKRIAFLICLIAGGAFAGPTTVNVDPLIKAMKPGATLDLPKAVYSTAGTLIITQSSVTVKFNGSTLTGPPLGAWFVPTGANVTLDGLIVSNGPCICNPCGPNFLLSNSNIGIGSPAGSVQQAIKTGPNGVNAGMLNCHIGECMTVSFYGDRGGEHGTNCTFAPSVHEYCLRLSGPDATTVPNGGLFTKCSFVSNSGPNTKDDVGVRTHTGVVFDTCDFSGNDIRWGQGDMPPTTKPGQYASGRMVNCTFHDIPGRSAISNLQGSILTVTGCTFTDPAGPPIAASNYSLTIYGNNTQVVTVGKNPYPFFFTNMTPPGESQYTGGDIVKFIHAPATQPSK